MKAAEFIIGFDGKRAAQNRTGLGNYSRFVVRGLSRYGYLKRGLLYVPKPTRTEALEGLDREQGMEVRSPQGWLSDHLSRPLGRVAPQHQPRTGREERCYRARPYFPPFPPILQAHRPMDIPHEIQPGLQAG